MSQGPSQSPRRLDSWKEIAAYLKHDLRTVERWERERGLPVHRVPSNKRSAVFAFVEELDTWLSGQTLSAQTPEQKDRVAVPGPRRMRSPVLWAGAAVIVILVALAARSWNSHSASLPARAELNGNKLTVVDGAGNVVWDHVFSGSVRRFPPGPYPAWDASSFTQVVDLDRDGKREVLVAVNYETGAKPQLSLPQLVCFSSDGKLLWRYQPSFAFRVGDRAYGDAWQIMDFVTSPDAATPVAWVVLASPTWGIFGRGPRGWGDGQRPLAVCEFGRTLRHQRSRRERPAAPAGGWDEQ